MPFQLTAKEAKTIRDRLTMGERYCREKQKAQMKRALKQYLGEHYKNMDSPSEVSRIVINYTMHVAQTRVHSVAFRYPRFVLTPETPDAEQKEANTQAWIKHSWKVGYIQNELRAAKLDAEIYGTGVVQTGWMFETDDGTVVDDGSKKGGRSVRQDRFFASRIFPGQFLISPECGADWNKAQWLGYWEMAPIEEVKDNPHFSNTRQLKGNADNLKGFLDWRPKENEDYPDDVKRVKLYHYYEKRRRIHVIMCDEHQKPLYAEEWPLKVCRYPFHSLLGPGENDCPWGMSMVLAVEHPQRELNTARSKLADYMRAAVPKLQCGPGTMNDKARNQVASDVPLSVVEHQSEAPAALAPIQIPPINPEVYSTEEKVLADFSTIAATGQYEMGRPPTKRTPGVEVQAIQSLGGARAQNDLSAFETLCSCVAKDAIAWGKKYAVKQATLPVYHKGEKRPYWQPVGKDEIAEEYEIEVAAHSTAAPNDADRLQSVAFFMQSLAPFLQFMPVAMQYGINLSPLLKQLLRALPDIQDAEEILEGLTRGQGLSQDAGTALPPGGGMLQLPAGEGQPAPEDAQLAALLGGMGGMMG